MFVRAAISRSQAVIRSVASPWNEWDRMNISCFANRVLIFGSSFSASCRQASRPSLSFAKNTLLRAAPLQITSVTQWSCADAARSSSSKIVAFGSGSVAFAALSFSFGITWYRCASVPLEHNATVSTMRPAPLRSRFASQANARPRTDSRRLRPTQRSTSDSLSECCKLIRLLAVCLVPAHPAIPRSARPILPA